MLLVEQILLLVSMGKAGVPPRHLNSMVEEGRPFDTNNFSLQAFYPEHFFHGRHKIPDVKVVHRDHSIEHVGIDWLHAVPSGRILRPPQTQRH